MSKEYIKKEAALNECDQMLSALQPGLKDTDTRIALRWCKAMINKLPTADVVPVVRCKDCKHYNIFARCVLHGYDLHYYDYYCADGERSDHE